MITKDAKIDRVDAIIDEIVQRILVDLESAKSTDLSDVRYAKKDIAFSRHSLRKNSIATDRNKTQQWN